MKVKELIEKLSTLNQEATVVAADDDVNCLSSDIIEVTQSPDKTYVHLRVNIEYETDF